MAGVSHRNELAVAMRNAYRHPSYGLDFAFPEWVVEPEELDKLDWDSVRIYFNEGDDVDKVHQMAHQREPFNIFMNRGWNEVTLEELTGHRMGAYSNSTADRLMPNIAAYCVTPVVHDGGRLDSVHVVNLVGFAFDHQDQPDVHHFGGRLGSFPLNEEALFAAYVRMWRFAFQAAHDAGLKKLHPFPVGCGAFSPDEITQDDFKEQFYLAAIEAARNSIPHGHTIEIIERGQYPDGFYIPDALFKKASPEELASTLYVNAWDPWSFVGNGNATDSSLDGYWGRSSAMAVLCWPRTNSHIQFVGVAQPGAGMQSNGSGALFKEGDHVYLATTNNNKHVTREKVEVEKVWHGNGNIFYTVRWPTRNPALSFVLTQTTSYIVTSKISVFALNYANLPEPGPTRWLDQGNHRNAHTKKAQDHLEALPVRFRSTDSSTPNPG